MAKNKTFLQITNKQFYEEFCIFKKENNESHQKIIDLIGGKEGIMTRISKAEANIENNKRNLKWGLGALGTAILTAFGWIFGRN